MRILTVPGIGNSGPAHWQTLWEQRPDRRCMRFAPESWDEPVASDWLSAVRAGLAALGPDTIVVAHSLGCLAVAALAVAGRPLCRGAVLVAPPDVHGPEFPTAAVGFADLPAGRLTIPALVVASSDDPYCSAGESRRLAATWGADLIDVGPGGHLNGASGLGEWPQGWDLVRAFAAGLSDD